MKKSSIHSQFRRVWICLGHSSPWCTPGRRQSTSLIFSSTSEGSSVICKRGDASSVASISSLGVRVCSSSIGSLCNNDHPSNFQHCRLAETVESPPPELVAGLERGVEREKVDCVVIGAGVVGLAVAREIAKQGREVVVLEAAEGIGTGTSSRSSEVIHAGIYYPPGSLKARLCVEGKEAMYTYCREREIPHKNVAKLIVASNPDQIPVLEKLAGLGKANSVNDLHMISGAEAMRLEPALQFDYVVDPRRGDKFYSEIRKYYPALPDEALQPGYSGVRPKIFGKGQPPADFLIQGEAAHGVPGLINLYGIESPGLTSSLGIAKLVGNLVSK